MFPLTRASALARLDEFLPHAGSAYAARRNHVGAAGGHNAVSRLSAALRRRLISEREVVEAVLAAHTYPEAETFIAEVFWRTYWKGWLEQRPAVWSQALDDAAAARAGLAGNRVLAIKHDAAVRGETGIEAFDEWARELAETGYLHNWARMQVASIWVFTLRLPWTLGAAWMFERLIDADPASNTLSWRWVSGLHTAGKTYLADTGRISRMTGGRLVAAGLAVDAGPLEGGPMPPQSELRRPSPPDPEAPSVVMLTPDDLSLEFQLTLQDVRVVVAPCSLARSTADTISLEDGLSRAAAHWSCPAVAVDALSDVITNARQHGCTQIVTPFAPVGSTAGPLRDFRTAAAEAGLSPAEHQRDWDRLAWPHCGKGFFQLKSRIPQLLSEQGVVERGAAGAMDSGPDGR